MSQGRKGMDNEAIDDFKGLVCFRFVSISLNMSTTLVFSSLELIL
jgi:hypothetical protein